MHHKKILALVVTLVIAASLVLGGCAASDTDGKGTVNLVYVQWACAESQTHIAEAVLEDMDYTVEKTVVAAGPMWTAVAEGDADALLCGWLPYTHEAYMEEFGDQVEDLGVNFEGARLGMVVPEYVTIDSIAELPEHSEEFEGTIYGIDPGSGLMRHTKEETIPTYGLEEFELIDSSDMAMTAALERAYEKDEWVVVTGWSPHWKFFAYDLKYLEDPENTYGDDEKIHVIARDGFSEDMPEVADMLSEFYLTSEQLGEVMYEVNVNDVDPEEAAREWVDANQDVVSEWIPS
ncbi:MAG: glycine betaine ABC transporter substrate-binding protein [Chloroflexota bacterium]